MIADAIEAGDLDADIDAGHAMQQQFDLLLRSPGMHGWVTGEIGDDQLGPAMSYGFRLMLCGAATEACRPRLRAQLLDSQTRVVDVPPETKSGLGSFPQRRRKGEDATTAR